MLKLTYLCNTHGTFTVDVPECEMNKETKPCPYCGREMKWGCEMKKRVKIGETYGLWTDGKKYHIDVIRNPLNLMALSREGKLWAFVEAFETKQEANEYLEEKWNKKK